MFVPKPFAFDDQQEQLAFIRDYSFALLTTNDLQATHLPLLVQQKDNELYLVGHVARANPHWRKLDNTPALAVFSGPHAYIAPSWYNSAPNVPTWNYTAVHVKGTLSILDGDATMQAVDELMSFFAPGDTRSRAAAEQLAYQDKLLKGIVGISMHVSEIQGVRKLGQQKSKDDQKGVIAGLSSAGDHESLALLDYMRRHNIAYPD